MPDIYVAPKKTKSQKKDKVNKRKKLRKKKKFPRSPLLKALYQIGVKPSRNNLTAFVTLPKKVKFENQEKKEKIILLLRRHWTTNSSWILIVCLMVFAPLFLNLLPLLNFLPFRFQIVVIIMWYLLILSFVFDRFLSWFFNVYIITDERIIDVDFVSLVYREISQAKIDKIQDVTYKSGGLLKTVFNYGDVFIQTAAEIQTIEFESVPRPDQVVKIISQLISQEEQERIEGRER